MNRLSLLVAALLPFAAIASDNLLHNASFEKTDAQKLPAEWKLTMDKGMNAKVSVLPGAAPGGGNALSIANDSRYGAGRIALRQFLPLIPGQEYELSCKVKGNVGPFLSFALGNKWQTRLWLRRSDDWKVWKLLFTPQEDQFSWKNAFQVCLLVEDACHAELADVSLRPVNALTPQAGSLPGGAAAELSPKPGQIDSLLKTELLMKPAEGAVILRLATEKGETFDLPLPVLGKAAPGGLLAADIQWNTETIPGGKLRLELRSGSRTLLSLPVEKTDWYGDFTRALAAFRTRYAALRPRLERQSKQPRCLAVLTVSDQQLGLLEQDMANSAAQDAKDYYGKRGLRIVAELNDLAADSEKMLAAIDSGNPPPAETRFVSSPYEWKEGFIEATVVDADGKSSRRPVFFSGYGHFDRAVRDIPMFQKIGADMIQFEVPMHTIVVGEREDGSFIFDWSKVDRRFSGIDSAQENNVAVAFLLGTHYFPEWALKAHPEVLWESGSFLRFDVQHPYARKMLEAFIREVMRKLKTMKGAKSVHSICLSNEPRYLPSLRSKFTRGRFLDVLKKKYGTVAKLNAAYGTSFDSFESAVPEIDPKPETQPGLFYDFALFRMDDFNDWHNWMAKIVQEEWPGMPVHSKVTGNHPATSVELERFSKWSTLHGGDIGIGFNQRTNTFSHGEMLFGLMRSVKPVSILNTENHLIPDDVEAPVPYDALYCALFQQFVAGVAGSAAWVWEDYNLDMFRKHHVFVGDLYRRPMGIMALRDAAADANRMAGLLKEAYLSPSDVALLYSVPSELFNPGYTRSCSEVWTALEKAGRFPRFVSEEQLIRGDLGKTRVVIAPNASVVTPEAAEKLAEFAAKDGTVLSVGDSFRKTPYGKALAVKVPFREIPMEKLDAALDAIVGRVPVKVTASGGDVRYRVTPVAAGGFLVNVVNFGSAPAEIDVERGGRELIREQDFPAGKHAMRPYEVLMLRIP